MERNTLIMCLLSCSHFTDQAIWAKRQEIFICLPVNNLCQYNSAFSLRQEERQHCSSLLVKGPDMLITSPF